MKARAFDIQIKALQIAIRSPHLQIKANFTQYWPEYKNPRSWGFGVLGFWGFGLRRANFSWEAWKMNLAVIKY